MLKVLSSRQVLFICLAFVLSCGQSAEEYATYSEIQGRTMGTTYSIIANGELDERISAEIDALLVEVNHSVSTYEKQSIITRINDADSLIIEAGESLDSLRQLLTFFAENMEVAGEIFNLSQGAFDPTVGPLVKYWGFGWEKNRPAETDSAKLDSLKALVGYGKIDWSYEAGKLSVVKENAEAILDFSALAKGYGVDEVAEMLEQKGIDNYLIEIGGEVRVKGRNRQGAPWTLGINNPLEGAGVTDFYARVGITEGALATSGNYRNYYEMEGRKVFHSINPVSGYPEMNNLRSASIYAESCIRADALATACMILGVERSMELIGNLENTEAFFIYATPEGSLKDTMTSGFRPLLITE